MIDRRRQISRRRSSDRREDLRESLATGIRFVRAGTPIREILRGEILDVSATGICLLLKDRLELADRMLVEVRGLEQRCFNLTAEVVWVERDPGGRYRTGCELRVPLTDKQQDMLQQFATAAVPV